MKIDSIFILFRIPESLPRKKSKISQRTGIGIKKESDLTQHYFLHASYLDFVGSQVEELEVAEALERLDGNRVEEVEREVQLHQVGQL